MADDSSHKEDAVGMAPGRPVKKPTVYVVPAATPAVQAAAVAQQAIAHAAQPIVAAAAKTAHAAPGAVTLTVPAGPKGHKITVITTDATGRKIVSQKTTGVQPGASFTAPAIGANQHIRIEALK